MTIYLLIFLSGVGMMLYGNLMPVADTKVKDKWIEFYSYNGALLISFATLTLISTPNIITILVFLITSVVISIDIFKK